MFNTFINIGNLKWIVFLTFPLCEVSNPNMVINLLCHFFDNALVSTSVTIFFVEQYSNMTLPFSTHFWTKWCWTLMCFVQTFCVGLFVNDITPWLSHQITIPFFSFMYLNSFMNFVIHMASLITCVLAMYSASVIDKMIMSYCCYSKKWFHFPSRIQTLWWISYPQVISSIHITISNHLLGR